MQIVRTLLWILLLIGVLAFSFGNWDKQIDVRIWPGIVWDTRVPALVIVSFLIGIVPMWLYHRGVRWRQERRISALEQATTTMAGNKAVASTPAETAAPSVAAPATAPSTATASAEPANPVDPEPQPKK